MKRWLFVGLLLFGILSSTKSAAVENKWTQIALHATTRNHKYICPSDGDWSGNPGSVSYGDYTTEFPLLTASTVYFIACRGDSISGASFGIEYCESAVGIFDWTSCLESYELYGGENGPWPSSKSAIRITGNVCSSSMRYNFYESYYDAGLVLGSMYVYAYSESMFSIVPDCTKPEPELVVRDCGGSEIDLLDHLWIPFATVYFGNGPHSGGNPCTFHIWRSSSRTGPYSVDPCLLTPVQRATWGMIKTRYGGPQKE